MNPALIPGTLGNLNIFHVKSVFCSKSLSSLNYSIQLLATGNSNLTGLYSLLAIIKLPLCIRFSLTKMRFWISNTNILPFFDTYTLQPFLLYIHYSRPMIFNSVLQEFLKHAIPDYLVRGTDLFSLRLSNKNMTTANTTIAIWCEWIKIIPILLSDWQKNFFLECCRILVISLCVPWVGKG